MPLSFIDHEKLEVWKKLKLKIPDEDVKKNIDIIWIRWSNILYDKEKEEAAHEDLNVSDQVFSPNYTPSVAGSPANIRSVSMFSPATPGTNCHRFSASSPVSGSSFHSSISASPVVAPRHSYGTSPYTPGASFNQSPFTHARSPFTPGASTASSPYTPGSCHTPYTPSTPGGPITPSDDVIIEEISIPIFANDQSIDEVFKYGKKRSDKFVCLTPDCKVPYSKNSKIKDQGVTLQTLKNHALKDHSIKVKVKEKKAFLTTPLKCRVCNKNFSRSQTLKEHELKTHKMAPSTSEPRPSVPEFKEPDNSTFGLLHPNINIESLLRPDQIQTVQDYISTESVPPFNVENIDHVQTYPTNEQSFDEIFNLYIDDNLMIYNNNV